jgi:succinate-semialdehyde dehydrogenase/glutarate-semialdehyde dehydrogenase
LSAYDEEVFGPVAAIINAEDEQEAINIANDTKFGLGAAIFQKILKKAEYIAKNIIQSGTCCVNDFVKSDHDCLLAGLNHLVMVENFLNWHLRICKY